MEFRTTYITIRHEDSNSLLAHGRLNAFVDARARSTCRHFEAASPVTADAIAACAPDARCDLEVHSSARAAAGEQCTEEAGRSVTRCAAPGGAAGRASTHMYAGRRPMRHQLLLPTRARLVRHWPERKGSDASGHNE